MKILNNYLHPHDSIHNDIYTHVDIPSDANINGYAVKQCIVRLLIDNASHEYRWIWEVWTTAFRLGGRSVYKTKEDALEALKQAINEGGANNG